MADYQDVWDALESTTSAPSGPTSLNKRAVASHHDINTRRVMLLRFLEEIDGDITVSELRDALEEY